MAIHGLSAVVTSERGPHFMVLGQVIVPDLHLQCSHLRAFSVHRAHHYCILMDIQGGMRAVPFGKDPQAHVLSLLTGPEEMRAAALAVAGYRQLPLLLFFLCIVLPVLPVKACWGLLLLCVRIR